MLSTSTVVILISLVGCVAFSVAGVVGARLSSAQCARHQWDLLARHNRGGER